MVSFSNIGAQARGQRTQGGPCSTCALTLTTLLNTIGHMIHEPQALSAIRRRLGKPMLETTTSLLYKMDCVEGLRALDANCIPLVVTSPPYNIGKESSLLLVPADRSRKGGAEWRLRQSLFAKLGL